MREFVFSGTLTFFLREFYGKFLTFERQKLKIETHIMQKPCSLRHPQLIGFGWIIAMKFGEISSSDQFDIVLHNKRVTTCHYCRIEWNSSDLDGFGWSRLLSSSIISSKKSYINIPSFQVIIIYPWLAEWRKPPLIQEAKLSKTRLPSSSVGTSETWGFSHNATPSYSFLVYNIL